MIFTAIRIVIRGVLLLVAALVAAEPAASENNSTVEVVPQIGHSSRITAVAFSPDGAHIVSGSEDKTIKLWDVKTGLLVRTYEGHGGQRGADEDAGRVGAVALSDSGKKLLSAGEDGKIQVRDVSTGVLLRSFGSHLETVWSATFSHDGRLVLVGGWNAPIELWDLATGNLLRTFENQPQRVFALAFSMDGRRFINTCEEGQVRLHDLTTGQLLGTFEGQTAGNLSVAISPDGSHFASGGYKALRLWNIQTGQLVRILEDETGWVNTLAFSPDGSRLLSGGMDKKLKLWDTNTGMLLRIFEGHSGYVNVLAWAPDGLQIVSGGDDNSLKIWDANTGVLLRTLASRSVQVNDIALSPDRSRILSGGSDQVLRLWDSASGALIRNFETFSGEDGISSVKFSPDGTLILSNGKGVRLWDAASGVLLRSFADSEGTTSIAFSPNGTRMLSGDFDGTLKLWDVATGKQLRAFDPYLKIAEQIAYAPDGTRVLSIGGSDGAIKLWKIASGHLVRTFDHTARLGSVLWSPNGAKVVAGSKDGKVLVWDASSGRLLRMFNGHTSWVTSLSFSPDGTRLLSGGTDKTLKLWEVSTGRLVQTFAGQFGRVSSVGYANNDRWIASGHGDGAIRIWDVATGERRADLLAKPSGEWLTITPKGFFVGSFRDTDMLAIVRGVEPTTIGQVHQSLFNPDLVRETLAGDPDGEVERAAGVVNLEKVLDAGPPPAIAVTSHEPGSHSGADLATVAARITDRGKGIGRVEWRVNGVTVGVMSAPAGPGPDYDVTQELALDPGENRIEVIAYEGRNLLASLPAQTTIVYDGPADTAKPKLYVLAIGINAYVDAGWSPPGSRLIYKFPPLTGAVPDAEAFSAEMEKAGAGQYAGIHVIKALDKDATPAKLDGIFKKLAKEISPRDTFVFYAAAHGYTVSGNYYMIPQDYQGGPDPASLKARAIGQDRLQDWIANRIKAKRTVILLDTCESGALTGGYTKSRTEGPVSEAAAGRLHEATGRPVLTAASPGKLAYENYKGHGVFTYALMEALHRGDTNGNGKIEVSELAAYVEMRVPELFAELKQSGWVVKGLAAASVSRGGKEQDKTQTAHFGSTGEDFSLVARLP